MATQKKAAKAGGKKTQVKVADMKPRKDAKGGISRLGNKPLLQH